MKTFTLILSGLAMMLGTTSAQSPQSTPWRLEVKVASGKSDRQNRRGEIDDRDVKLKFTTEVSNRETSRTLEGAKVTLIAFGVHVHVKKSLQVLVKEQATLNIGPLKSQKQESKEVRLQYDDKAAAQFGYKYLGYIVVVKDASGKVIYTGASPTTLLKGYEKALDLNEGSYCDRDYLPGQAVSRF